VAYGGSQAGEGSVITSGFYQLPDAPPPELLPPPKPPPDPEEDDEEEEESIGIV